jgi:histidinol dehydrogenase
MLQPPRDLLRRSGRHGPALARLGRQDEVASVQSILADVAQRGDASLVDIARRFDNPGFTADQIRVRPVEMKAAASKVHEFKSCHPFRGTSASEVTACFRGISSATSPGEPFPGTAV